MRRAQVALAKDQAYIRLPLDNLSVAQALTYCSPPAGGAAGATGAAAGAPGLAGGSGGVAAGGPGGVGAGTTTAEGLGRVGRCVVVPSSQPSLHLGLYTQPPVLPSQSSRIQR
jgi:hypothetical protein